MKYFLLLCLSAILLTGPGCDEKKSTPVGAGVIDRDDFGQFYDVRMSPADRDTTVQTDIPLYAGPELLVGQWAGYQTKSLLKFGVLPDSGQVLSASLRLVTYGVIDTETVDHGPAPDSLDFVLSLVESEWDSSKVTFETLPPATPLLTFTMGRSADDTITLSLDEDLVQGWIDGTANNYGFLLSYNETGGFPGEGFIKKFYSGNSSTGPPRLTLAWLDSDTLSGYYIPTADVFAVNRLTEWPFDRESERLMVANGYPYRSLLFFDVGDSVPAGATIVRGNLTLFIDHAYSFFNSMDIGIYAVSSDNWDVPEFNSSQLTWETIDTDEDSVVFGIYWIIQDWIDGDTPNYGVLVRSIHEDWDINSVVFHASSGPAELSPKLDITYGTPPDFTPKNCGEGDAVAK